MSKIKPSNPEASDMASIRQLHDRYMTPNYAPMAIIPDHGSGSYLWDIEGREYLDFASGIAVSALGHAHPELVGVLVEQAGRYWHVSNVLTSQPAIQLARKLCELTFAERVFFANSGSEANEAALKLARRYAFNRYGEEKHEILAFDNAFHGRTLFTVNVGGQPAYSNGFGPKPAGISHRPFNDPDSLRQFFEERGKTTCAVILEPCQGEAGVVPASTEFVKAVRDCCNQYDALMILDEIQTGVGRSGKLYTYQKMGVTPDILTTAKALGGGFPISAMLTTEEIGKDLVVGSHGSTFGGNPMACAVAGKILEIVSQPDMLTAIEAHGRHLVDGLRSINDRYDVFREVRGTGLLLGCELVDRYKGEGRKLLATCISAGLLVLVAGPDVIRLAPPLNISTTELDQGLERFENAVGNFVADSKPSP